MKKLLLVDKKDKVIGTETKEKCHQGKGILHRAFSVYIFKQQGPAFNSTEKQVQAVVASLLVGTHMLQSSSQW